MQNTHDVAIGLTKLWGTHTFKVGYQSQDSMKLQNLGTVTFGALPFEGRVTFSNDSNNPLDSGFGYANAALGIFSRFEQQNALFEGDYVYHNKDFYIQDNWKVNSRLTLDIGMRFTHHGPQYDVKQQASNFFPDQWSASRAPQLYVPGCASGSGPGCPRVAVDPRTGASLGAGSSVAIGTIVPNTGTLLNGIIQAGNGIAKENYTEQALVFGPRIGAAYDVTGTQRIVLRGSVGVFYDRLQGDSIFGQIGNPPTGQGSTVVNSTLQQVAQGTAGVQPPPVMLIYDYDAKIGASTSWNGGVQMVLPWSSALDVSYVGTHNYNSVSFGSISVPPNSDPMDLNAPDIGTAYLPQYQDPTAPASTIPGARALPTDLMRPYRGLGAIIATRPIFYTQYDSLQTSFNRRFRNGWQGGINWTLSLRHRGRHVFAEAPAAQRRRHDRSSARAGCGRRSALERGPAAASHQGQLRMGSSRRHGGRRDSKVLAAVANDWQVSGVFTGGNGAPYDVTYSYQTAGANVNLTGSPNYRARIRTVGDIGSGCSSDQYAQFNANRVRRSDVQQPRRRIGGQPAERLLGQDDRSRDRPQHSHRRQPADTVPSRSVQRVQCRRHQRAQHDDSIQQPVGGDDDYEQPVQC